MERAKAIFEYALDLQPEEREHFLQQVSSEDPQLLQEVRRLLDRAQADTEEVSAPPPVEPSKVAEHKYIFSSGDLIAGRHRVLRTIASGGMGEVYEVQDLELNERVALKVISLKSAAKPNSAEMFRREITLARQVTHPNVCRIYDIGHHDHPEHGDLLFLTMEFLEGRTLADRIRTQGTLTKEEALPLLAQMIDALAAAHKLNIAHRDFKSANVILCEAPKASGSNGVTASTPSTGPLSPPAGGPEPARKESGEVSDNGVVVKVTDFGLARSIDAMDTTVHGEIWGTPDYMAPEQFRGHSSTVSDIYALGVVIYEMFTAKLPHRSSTSPVGPDGKPSAAMEKIPAEWRPVVRKCMAFSPADRYANVEDVWSALKGDESTGTDKPGILHLSRKALAAIAATLLFAVGLAGWMNRETIRRWFNPVPEQKHIAVLQFENVGGDAANAAFAAGVGETLASRLSQLGSDGQTYWVVPFSDSRKYTDIEQARRNLDVTLVVTGAVQRTGDTVQMTVNVIDARKHKQLSSRVMTASVADLSVLQDQAWQSVAQMVQQPVDPVTKKTLDDSSTRNARAYDYYEQGMGYLQQRDAASLDKAILAFQQSAAEDPNFALAQAGLGNAYANKYAITKDPQWMADAKEHGDRAVALSPNFSAVHEALGQIYEKSGELDRALAEYNRAVELNPMAITSSLRIGKIYALQGKYADSEAVYKRALGSTPWYWAGYAGLGTLYFNRGQFSQAAEQYQKMTELAPDHPMGYENLGAAYSQMGQYPKAVEVLEKGLAVNPSPALWSDLGGVYMFMGENAKAAEAMKKAVELSPHDHTLLRNLADSYRQVPSLANQAPATYRKALETAQQQLSVNPHDREALVGMALYEAHLGDQSDARKYVTKALQEAPDDSGVLFNAALVYELGGDRQQALTLLQKSIRAGFSVEDVKREPELQDLRSDPKYQQIVHAGQMEYR